MGITYRATSLSKSPRVEPQTSSRADHALFQPQLLRSVSKTPSGVSGLKTTGSVSSSSGSVLGSVMVGIQSCRLSFSEPISLERPWRA